MRTSGSFGFGLFTEFFSNPPVVFWRAKLRRFLLATCSAAAVLAACGQQAQATVYAYDDASDPAYNSGWLNGANGGFGFNPWSLSSTAMTGGNFTIESSGLNGSGGGPGIDSPVGKAWTIQSFGQFDYPYAQRTWTHAFQVGDTFSCDLDTGWGSSGTAQQFGLDGANLNGPTEVFVIAYGNTTNYSIYDGHTQLDTGVRLTDGGIHVDFTWTSPSNCDVSLTVLATSSTTSYNIFCGLPQALVMQSLGPLSGQDYYLNRMSITVPEPAASLIVGVGMICIRRRVTSAR